MKWLYARTCMVFASSLHLSTRLMNTHSHVSAFSLYPFTKNVKDIFRYKSKMRRKYKEHHNYVNYVQDHHCIPKEWREHELLKKLNFDINCSCNIVIMPNTLGKKILNLHPDTLVHQGGHHKYNQYVKQHMDDINMKSGDECKYEFWLFLHHLKSNLHLNKENIPWK